MMTRTLAPHHRAMLEVESGIDPDVIAERGYWTATTDSDLAALGYGPTQQRLHPALVVPQYNHAGVLTLHQIRPDNPRTGTDGKTRKYEFPKGARPIISVPPRAVRLRWLANPEMALWITEGDRKADATVSRGECCVSISGVWGWVGLNEFDGKTALIDWKDIALNGRAVYLAFDSDVATKPEVWRAQESLARYLKNHGATVLVVRIPEVVRR
jgi:hypothetical protein